MPLRGISSNNILIVSVNILFKESTHAFILPSNLTLANVMNYKQAKQISDQSLFPFHFMPLANASVDISNGLAVFEKRAMSFV